MKTGQGKYFDNFNGSKSAYNISGIKSYGYVQGRLQILKLGPVILSAAIKCVNIKQWCDQLYHPLRMEGTALSSELLALSHYH